MTSIITGVQRTPVVLLCLFFAAFFVIGCKKSEQPSSKTTPASTTTETRPKIIAFGDSLTAGLGLTAEETYPAQLQKLLDAKAYRYEVVNAGVSGDTTAGGVRRIDWVMDGQVKFIVLELGANDILRGQPIPALKENLSKIIESAQSKGATVILTGMEAPTNSGPEYRLEVHNAYPDLAEKYKLPFLPFILKGIAGVESLNQEDLSHPNATGAKILAQNVFEILEPLLKKQ